MPVVLVERVLYWYGDVLEEMVLDFAGCWLFGRIVMSLGVVLSTFEDLGFVML